MSARRIPIPESSRHEPPELTPWDFSKGIYTRQRVPGGSNPSFSDSRFMGIGTGMTDHAGNVIFSGDVMQYPPPGTPVYEFEPFLMVVRFGLHPQPNTDEKGLGFYVSFISPKDMYWRQDFPYWAKESVVIGNIYDSPELLIP